MNYDKVADLHIRALPHTPSSRRGVGFVARLYGIVARIGYVKTVNRDGEMVGVVSGIGRWILTLVVDPQWQHKGIGRELIGKLGQRLYVYTEVCTVGFYEKLGFRKMFTIGPIHFLWRK